jgi:hypothetical protein
MFNTMRLLHNPTLHFLVILILAPIFAVVGTSLDCADWDLSATLAGWLVTLSLLSIFGIRSIVYQWKAIPRKYQERWSDLLRAFGIELRLLMGIGLVTLFSLIAALIICGFLILSIVNAIIARSHLAVA